MEVYMMKKFYRFGMTALLVAAVIFAACDLQNGAETADKTALEAAISAANTAKEGVVASADGSDIDSAVYWVTPEQLEVFVAAIAAAQGVYDNIGADQAMVDNAKSALEAVTTEFNGQKRQGTGGTETNYDIYVAGQTFASPDSSTIKVWKNNSLLYTLTDGSNGGQAEDIVVVGNDVYVLTMEMKSPEGSMVKVWKNGALLYTIYNGSDWVSGDSLFVNGTDVYVAGSGWDGYTGKIFKNGSVLYSFNREYPRVVSVMGSDVYAGGSKENNIARIWKNGNTYYSLTPDNSLMGNIFSMAFDGNDVYSAGYEENDSNNWVAKVWKNTAVLYTLTDGAHSAVARVVEVVGNDVYILEDEWAADLGKIRVWKNNSLLYTLVEKAVSPPAMIMALDMVVMDGNVYSLGIDGTSSKVWKDDTVLYSVSIAEAGFSALAVAPKP
jgi:hypothetical protein